MCPTSLVAAGALATPQWNEQCRAIHGISRRSSALLAPSCQKKHSIYLRLEKKPVTISLSSYDLGVEASISETKSVQCLHDLRLPLSKLGSCANVRGDRNDGHHVASIRPDETIVQKERIENSSIFVGNIYKYHCYHSSSVDRVYRVF